jgi:hypothetical protein
LTVDHFRPVAQGGTDELKNLVYCCHACNSFKGELWFEAGMTDRILNPRFENIREHIAVGPDHLLIGLTQTGRFHIACMHLNRLELVAYRLKRAREAELEVLIHEQQIEISRLFGEVRDFEREVQTLMTRLSQLNREHNP